MNSRLFGCGKFSRLLSDREDRALTDRELRFLGRHKAVCDACARQETSFHQSLNMLRGATLNPVVTKGFDERVLRRLRVNRVKQSIEYWSPALMGSAVACIALLVTLNLLAGPAVKSAHLPDGEAMRMTSGFPKLELHTLPPFNR